MRYRRMYKDLDVTLKPVFLGAIMKASGNSPPATNPAKGKYMLKDDIPSNSKVFGVNLKPPSNFPFLSLLGQRLLVWVQLNHPDKLEDCTRSIYQLTWGSGTEISDAAILERVQKHIPHKPEITDTIKQKLMDQTKECTDRGAFGLPWIVVTKNGKEHVFFGSDRFEQIFYLLEKPYPGVNPKL
ncbi:DSBA-like thioredoxin domain-containing protein [Gorgonomyces haynaldii]|nr:DSBA-like thioredoxin domain-containing protein [Gorgonomyces haynaldii]